MKWTSWAFLAFIGALGFLVPVIAECEMNASVDRLSKMKLPPQFALDTDPDLKLISAPTCVLSADTRIHAPHSLATRSWPVLLYQSARGFVRHHDREIGQRSFAIEISLDQGPLQGPGSVVDLAVFRSTLIYLWRNTVGIFVAEFARD